MANETTSSLARRTTAACAPKPALDERALLSNRQAHRLAAVFKVLANDTRLRLLHALARKQELCVNDLATAVRMKPQAVSNQLQRLAAQSIVGSRPNGNQVFYRVADPCVTALLDRGWCLAEDACASKP
jgi:DNA-binding transcriptional ArsR family regulator